MDDKMQEQLENQKEYSMEMAIKEKTVAFMDEVRDICIKEYGYTELSQRLYCSSSISSAAYIFAFATAIVNEQYIPDLKDELIKLSDAMRAEVLRSIEELKKDIEKKCEESLRG